MVSGSSAACQGSPISSERDSRLLLRAVSRQHRGVILDRLLIAAHVTRWLWLRDTTAAGQQEPFLCLEVQ